MITIGDKGFCAKVIAHSENEFAQQLLTVEATYPRIVHAEVLTHRDRERNSASSRAIPWLKMTERVVENPFVPLVWGREQSGMQTGKEISPGHAMLADLLWDLHHNLSLQIGDFMHNIGSTYEAVYNGKAPVCNLLAQMGVDVDAFRLKVKFQEPTIDSEARIHKSLPNRLTEAHQFITVVMTATAWKNFFALRCHHMAEVHFQKIACMIRQAMSISKPRRLRFGDWHLPYADDDDTIVDLERHNASFVLENAKKVSVARCARVSYLTQDGKRDITKDLDLYNRLLNPEGPPHASAFGHVAMSATPDVKSGPFTGWLQHRKQLANECADNS
jgi:hypothetical protein